MSPLPLRSLSKASVSPLTSIGTAAARRTPGEASAASRSVAARLERRIERWRLMARHTSRGRRPGVARAYAGARRRAITGLQGSGGFVADGCAVVPADRQAALVEQHEAHEIGPGRRRARHPDRPHGLV